MRDSVIMRYSADLRKRVLDFVDEGGSITAASRTFCISRMCIYTWLKSEDPLTSKKPGPRGPYRLNYEALRQHVIDFPDHTQLERASHFGVSKHCIWYALKKMKITRKKSSSDIKNNML